MNFTFKKIAGTEQNEQTVTREDGVVIGTVWQQWFRLGGDGWAHSLDGRGGRPTRKEAARELNRSFNKTN